MAIIVEADASYVIDWLKQSVDLGGRQTEFQRKVRSKPPQRPVLRFVDARGALLLTQFDLLLRRLEDWPQ